MNRLKALSSGRVQAGVDAGRRTGVPPHMAGTD
jgi:hypothetical protein